MRLMSTHSIFCIAAASQEIHNKLMVAEVLQHDATLESFWKFLQLHKHKLWPRG